MQSADIFQRSGARVPFTVYEANLPGGSKQMAAGSTYTFSNPSGYAAGQVVGSVLMPGGFPMDDGSNFRGRRSV